MVSLNDIKEEPEKMIILSDMKGENQVILGHGTKIKVKRETSTKSTVCFDEVLTSGAKKTAWTINVDRVSYESYSTSMEIEQTLESLLDVAGMLTIRELIKPAGETPYIKKQIFTNVILNGEDYELKPEEYTVNNLTFKTGIRLPVDFEKIT